LVSSTSRPALDQEEVFRVVAACINRRFTSNNQTLPSKARTRVRMVKRLAKSRRKRRWTNLMRA
jgi:hypothetical protein